MVPDKFNMVDMEGIDILASQGEIILGLYNKLVESIAQCRYQCLYNWYFDSVLIPPTYVEAVVDPVTENILINTGIYVTPGDVIMIASPDAGKFILWKVVNVTGYRSFSTAVDFRNAYLSELLNNYNNISIRCLFRNNTSNTRAAIDYCYAKFNDNNVSTQAENGHRVGGLFADAYGADVYSEAQIYIYYSVLDTESI